LIILSKYITLKKTPLKIGLLFCIFFFSVPCILYSQSREYTLKAVYIEKFTRFTNWPPQAEIKNKEKFFKIYVLGNKEFSETLNNIFSIQKIYEKPVEVKLIKDLRNIDDCHILYISEDFEEELTEIIKYVEEKPVLTISDTEGFAKKGVIINFYIKKNKLRFEINETALHLSPLEMSFFLLNMAKVVDPVKSK